MKSGGWLGLDSRPWWARLEVEITVVTVLNRVTVDVFVVVVAMVVVVVRVIAVVVVRVMVVVCPSFLWNGVISQSVAIRIQLAETIKESEMCCRAKWASSKCWLNILFCFLSHQPNLLFLLLTQCGMLTHTKWKSLLQEQWLIHLPLIMFYILFWMSHFKWVIHLAKTF